MILEQVHRAPSSDTILNKTMRLDKRRTKTNIAKIDVKLKMYCIALKKFSYTLVLFIKKYIYLNSEF